MYGKETVHLHVSRNSNEYDDDDDNNNNNNNDNNNNKRCSKQRSCLFQAIHTFFFLSLSVSGKFCPTKFRKGLNLLPITAKIL